MRLLTTAFVLALASFSPLSAQRTGLNIPGMDLLNSGGYLRPLFLPWFDPEKECAGCGSWLLRETYIPGGTSWEISGPGDCQDTEGPCVEVAPCSVVIGVDFPATFPGVTYRKYRNGVLMQEETGNGGWLTLTMIHGQGCNNVRTDWVIQIIGLGGGADGWTGNFAAQCGECKHY